jgi:hypothetical protein
VYLSVFAIFLIVRFFRVFSMQPKLAMVTNTLYYAWVDIFHHMIIFLTMLISYGFAGMFIFGRRDPGFSDIVLAVAQCFVVMLGEFDSETKAQENPMTAFFWFYSFTVIVAFLIINCLMAIIMDVYVEVKANAVNIQTVWDHLWEMCKDWLQCHSVVSIKVVQAAITKHMNPGENNMIDSDILTQLVPGMAENQSIRLVSGAIARMKEEEENRESLTAALTVTGSINVMVHRVLTQLNVLLEGFVAQRDLFRVVEEKMAGSDAPREPLHLQCQEFDTRRAAIEVALASMERFLEDCACWDAYRTLEMHEQLSKIQDRLVEGRKKHPPALPSRNQMPAPEPLPPLFLKMHGEAVGRNDLWSNEDLRI